MTAPRCLWRTPRSLMAYIPLSCGEDFVTTQPELLFLYGGPVNAIWLASFA